MGIGVKQSGWRFAAASAIGTSHQQVAKYENDGHTIPAWRLRKLCAALNITPNELLNFDASLASRVDARVFRTAGAIERLPPQMQAAVLLLIDVAIAAAPQPTNGAP